MKSFIRLFLIILVAFSFAVIPVSAKSNKKSNQKITLYLFRRTGCPHCQEEMKFLDSIINDYKSKMNIVVYDVTQGDNNKLLQDVAAELGVSVDGVPFTVIGKQHIVGYASQLDTQFKQTIDQVYKNQEEDLVDSVLEESVYGKLIKTDLYKAMEEEGLSYTSKKAPGTSNLLPIIVFSSVAIAIGALIYYSRKK